MKIHRPRTFLNLVILSLCMVSLPLIVGLLSTVSSLEKLTKQGITVIDHSVKYASSSSSLSENLMNVERNIRLYEIVGEAQYFKKAQEWQDRLISVINSLESLPVLPETRQKLTTLKETGEKLLASVATAHNNPTTEKGTFAQAFSTFHLLHRISDEIQGDLHALIHSESQGIQAFSRKSTQALALQTIGFILATVLIMCVIAFLISRPVRQLNKGLERIGEGDFLTPVFVTGPGDIELIGERLDWLRRRLAELEREKTKFIAHLSHELKTPLASIREGAGLLGEELVGTLNSKQREVCTILMNNSIKLQHLIENILDFNMAKAGGKTYKQTQIQLHSLIDKVATEQRHKVLSRGVTFEMELAEVTVFGNEKELEVIFENLFSNALKFSKEDSMIGCRVTQRAEEVSCVVYDNGPGVPPDEQEKIFTPFYQVAGEGGQHVKGSGLGLAIVKEYVSRHGGKIVFCNGHAAGSAFEVILPVKGKVYDKG